MKKAAELTCWDYENGFYHTSHYTRIAKLVAHYELYTKIIGLPGHVVELGVYKAASFIRFCSFREMLESPFSRKIIGFDAFGAFPIPAGASAADLHFVEAFENEGGEGLSLEEADIILKAKGFVNYELIGGDILQTVPDYVDTHPEMRIALLHIDVDIYKPTVVALEYFYDRIVPGGFLVFDDYSIVAGETDAVDEFFANKGLSIQKLPISHRPAYIQKK